MTLTMTLKAQVTCPDYDWNPVATASSWVPFTGGIAGFLFTGLVFLLSTDPKGRQEATNAFTLLITAFFGFLTMAYLTAGLSGEQNCTRAYTGFAITGGVLATSVICMCITLTWLLPAYERYNQEILPFLRHVVYFIFTLAAIMLAVSSFGFLQTTVGTNLVFHAVVMGATALAAIATGFTAVYRKRHTPLSPDKRNDRVKWLARLALGYLATASVITGIVMSIPNPAWDPPAHAGLYAAAYGSHALPLGILLWSIGAIALRTSAPPTSQVPPPRASEQKS
ncbi:hypothetical protein OHR68_29725 [Spirillospora sp. NBC_00431]